MINNGHPLKRDALLFLKVASIYVKVIFIILNDYL